MDKKLIIIGAGVSGLSCGIMAQKYGFKTTIFEKNNFAGGNLTGWYRKGCYIDNCLHWLNGSKSGTTLNSLWKELGAIDSNTDFYQSEYFYESELGKHRVGLNKDLEITKNEMLKVSPNDAKQINKFISAVKKCRTLISGNKIGQITSLVSLGIKYGRKTIGDVAKMFISPLLQRFLSDYILPEYSIYVLLFAYASFTLGDGMVLRSGSKSMADKMIKKYNELGGKLVLSSGVKSVVTNVKRATGVILDDNKFVDADYVVCATDTNITFNKLLDKSLTPLHLKITYKNRRKYPIVSSFHIAYKVNNSANNKFDSLIFETIKPIKIGNTFYNRIMIKSYDYADTFTKDDSYILQVFLLQRERDYDYFASLSSEDYNKEKKRITEEVTNALLIKFQNLKENIEHLDTWTPYTYTKYFDAYKGSYMSFGITNSIRLGKIKNRIGKYKNLFLASQWQSLFGGLPNAARNGKECAEMILKTETNNV